MEHEGIQSDCEAARLLNCIVNTNFAGVGRSELQDLITDFFADDTRVEDDPDSDESDTEEVSNVYDSAANVSLTCDPTTADVFMNGDMQSDDLTEGIIDTGLISVNEAKAVLDLIDDYVVDDVKSVEIQKIEAFQCKCAAFRQGFCIKKLDPELVYSVRLDMTEMSDFEKDLIIIGKISATMNRSDTTASSKRASQKERKRQRTSYYVEAHQVCRKAFEFVHAISGEKLDACITWYKENGLRPRYKKSGGRRKDHRYLRYDDIQRVVTFVENYAEDHAIVLPGRIPGFKDFRMKLLPSCVTKSSVFRLYSAAMHQSSKRAVKNSTFRKLWNTLLPFIVLSKPMTDLCWTCQQNNYAVYRSANLPDAVKSRKLLKQEEHLRVVDCEREAYRAMVSSAKDTIAKMEDSIRLGINPPQSRNVRLHYSFDFAQQVHIPSDPLQPGPMYFLTPRKCGLFGVCCEGLPQQVNYLVDEAAASSKGSTAVISYLHHFFATYGLGETCCDLHCDNCTGQNKNKYMLWYLAWRVLKGLHKEITLNFLITGHTKFAPDWCFGLIKQRFRKTRVCCLSELEEVVRSSTATGVNVPQPVMSEQGEVIVEHFNWQEMEPYMKPVPRIKSYHHFRFSSDSPGTVFCKETVESQEEEHQLLKCMESLPPMSNPAIIPIPGLSAARQWYLFDKIRDFCSEETQDITCPKPAVDRSLDPMLTDEPVPAVHPAATRGRGRGRRSLGRGKRPQDTA